eukprot:TRINITY_DN5134_c0_g1_i1.p1 TRINITY_DN5134_c0_g1~~TRINITY_DN5134_c0_g1_i1.p1  ORF type:complete len:426 (-),score=48.71 TRINITY_DN5134_c0_g1_i1:97-1374(-)
MRLCCVFLVLAVVCQADECNWSPRHHKPNLNAVTDISSLTLEKQTAHGQLFSLGSHTAAPLKVLKLKGSWFEMGVAHGTLLKDEITTMIPQVYEDFKEAVKQPGFDLTKSTKALLKKYGFAGALDYVANLTAKYTPPSILQELKGISHGSGVDYLTLLRVHTFPELIQAYCSQILASGGATPTGHLVQARALDWEMPPAMRKVPLLVVYQSSTSNTFHSFVNLAWSGFVGTLTGINSHKIMFGDIGAEYVDASFGPMKREGTPFLYLPREVLTKDTSVDEATNTIQTAQRTVNLLVGIGDGKTGDTVGIKYSSDHAVPMKGGHVEPIAPWHKQFPEPSPVVWWCMDYLCPTFDKVLGGELEKYVPHHNVTAENILRHMFPTANTGNLHVMIYEAARDYIYISVAGAKSDAYAEPYMKFHLPIFFH